MGKIYKSEYHRGEDIEINYAKYTRIKTNLDFPCKK
jgi:hypothetical protein